jgi:hypothetical protein
MSVVVLYAVRLTRHVFLSETEVAALCEIDPDRLRILDPLYGRLILLAAGQPVSGLYDSLEATVGAICFRAITELTAGKSVTVTISNAPGKFYLEPKSKVIRVHGDGVEVFEAPAAELLPALYGCGIRFLDFYRDLHKDDPNRLARLADLDYWVAEAGVALGK